MTTASNTASLPPLFVPLQEHILGDVSCSQEDLTRYSTDRSELSVRPHVIVFPKSVRDIKHTLSFAREHDMPVTVYGNGQSQSGGALSEGIILCCARYMTSITTFDVNAHQITAEAGITIGDLRARTLTWGVDIPCLTETEHTSTLGGLVATNAITSKSFAHGTIGAWVKGLTVILDNGEEHYIADGINPSGRLLEIYNHLFPLLQEKTQDIRIFQEKSIPTSAGYNIWRRAIGPRQLLDIFIGAEGSLGIITSVTLSLTTKTKETSSLLTYTQANDIHVITSMYKEHGADGIFLVDKKIIEYRETGSMTHLQHFLEDETDKRYCVVGIFETPDESSGNTKRLHLAQALAHIGHTSLLLEDFEYQSFARLVGQTQEIISVYSQHYLTPLTAFASCLVPLHNLSTCISQLEKHLDAQGYIYTLGGYVGSGHISLIILYDKHKDTTHETLRTILLTIYTIITTSQGSVVGGDGEGITRPHLMKHLFPKAIQETCHDIKKVFDPTSLFGTAKKTYKENTLYYRCLR